jgi:hypothetical protein
MPRAKARRRAAPVRRSFRWTPAEDRVLARYVRQYSRGEVQNVSDAARLAHSELEAMHKDKSRGRASRRRSFNAIHSRMLDLVHHISPGRDRDSRPWSAEEQKVLHECARELKEKGLPNNADVVRKCQERLQGLWGEDDTPRSFKAISQKLRPIARDYDVPPRRDRWSPEETGIAKAWARRFLTFKDELLPWRVHEMAALMQVELETKGFKRTQASCKYMLSEMLGHGRRRNIDLES